MVEFKKSAQRLNFALTPKTIGIQVGAILALSLTLGAVFNSSNPIGIPWSKASSSPGGDVALGITPASLQGDSQPRQSDGAVHQSANDPGAKQSSWTVTSIHWPQVKPLLEAEQIVLVDSRPKKTFELYRIPGAVSLPYDSNDEEFHAFSQKYGTNSHLVVYCAGGTCQASTLLADKLLRLGYNRIQIMDEGYFGWLAQTKQATNPVASVAATAPGSLASPPSLPSEHAPDPPVAVPGDLNAANPSPTTWALAKPLISAGKVVLVDVRAVPTFKAGHIPGAVNLPESSAKPEDYLAFRARYGTDKPVVLYCSSITCSVSKRVALRLVAEYGFRNVRYMTGGFQAWQQAEQTSAKPNP
jgi:rhodanese-related sulfurtransferase